MGTAVVLVLVVLIGIYSVKKYMSNMRHGCCGSGDTKVKKVQPADKNAASYPYVSVIGVDGMTCKNCAARVENAFHRREGYLAKVDLKAAQVTVRMKALHTEDELRDIVARAGYTVTGVRFE